MGLQRRWGAMAFSSCADDRPTVIGLGLLRKLRRSRMMKMTKNWTMLPSVLASRRRRTPGVPGLWMAQ